MTKAELTAARREATRVAHEHVLALRRGGMTLAAIGREIGKTQERVRQMLAAAQVRGYVPADYPRHLLPSVRKS